MKLSDYLKQNAEILLEIFDEDMDFRGAFATGDKALDEQIENEIAKKLYNGNLWAWCSVAVSARIEINGREFTGYDYLGGCSYANEADFKAQDGYYPDMVDNALKDLEYQIRRAAEYRFELPIGLD